MPNHVTNILVGPEEIISLLVRDTTDEENQRHRKDFEDTVIRIQQRRADLEAAGEDVPIYWAKDPTYEPLPEKTIDFALVVPKPPNMEQGSCAFSEPLTRDEHGVARHENGEACWYRWNKEVWGTKWNAYSQQMWALEDGRHGLLFQTAWSHPGPVMQALSDRSKEAGVEGVLDVFYADEDTGSNCGAYRLTFGGGEWAGEYLVHEDEAPQWARSELAARVNHGVSYEDLLADWYSSEAEVDELGDELRKHREAQAAEPFAVPEVPQPTTES